MPMQQHFLNKRSKLLDFLEIQFLAEGKTEKPGIFRFRAFVKMVGVAGFELATPCTPCKCATRLRYTPTSLKL